MKKKMQRLPAFLEVFSAPQIDECVCKRERVNEKKNHFMVLLVCLECLQNEVISANLIDSCVCQHLQRVDPYF